LENKEENIIINDATNIKTKVKKPLTEAQTEGNKFTMKRLHEKNKSDPE
jgi:hypothetical protein